MAVILLHTGAAGETWFGSWSLDPTISIVLAAAAIAYWLAFRVGYRRGIVSGWRLGVYLSGLAALAVAMMGPPDVFSDDSFAAHMVQHLLFVQVAAPLIMLGQPFKTVLRALPPRTAREVLRATLARRNVRRVLAVLAHPVTITVLFTGSFVFWHLPTYYDAAVQHPLVHDLEHLTFFWSALLFWWVLIDPMPRSLRLSPSVALLVLFATWMMSDLLGATLTLAREPLYPAYAAVEHPWGLSTADDQRLGGVIMWAGGGGFYAAIMIGILAATVRRSQGSHKHPGRTGAGAACPEAHRP